MHYIENKWKEGKEKEKEKKKRKEGMRGSPEASVRQLLLK